MNTESNTNLITALYCRLSQEDLRAGESLSIENQKLILKKYAEDNGFKNLRFYVDDGFSGTDATRPSYVQMMNDVYDEKVGTVIVKDQSRLGRDHLETDKLMELTFPSYDVRFIAVNDGVDSANGFNEMSTLRNWFNDFYARDTSKKIRAVQRAKGERGERVGTTIPYGYMKDTINPKQIVPDPEAAPVVRRIFEMYADGIGIVKICDTFSKEKIVSPSVYAFRRTGNRSGNPNPDRPYHWAQTTVRKILSNQAYCGDTVNFKTYTKSNKLKKRLKNTPENIMIFENTHEPIISRKLFDMVQKHFAGRKRPDKQGEMDKYAGFLYCGECGSRLYLHRAKTLDLKNNNFMCGGYQSRKSNCTSHYIRESVLDEIVLASLKKVTAYARENSDEFYRIAAENGELEAKKLFRESESRKSEYVSRVKQLDSIISTLYEDRVTGRITPERYDTLASGYEQEQSNLKSKLLELESQFDIAKLRENCIRDFIEKARQYVEMPALTPELIKVFIKKIEVFEKKEKYSRTCGNKIIIYFTFQADKGMNIDGTVADSKTAESAE